MHLRIFELARNYLQYDTKQFNIIGGYLSPVHDSYGKSSLIDSSHRYTMCHIALESHKWLNVSDIEIEQVQWTPTADVLSIYSNAINHQLQHQSSTKNSLPVHPVNVLLLCGADLLSSVLVPNLWATEHLDIIFGKYGVAVIERTGMDLNELINNNSILYKYKHNIHIIPQTITNTISSTSVRQLLQKNQSVKYLIPDKVIDYIVKHELYGVDKQLYTERHLNTNNK